MSDGLARCSQLLAQVPRVWLSALPTEIWEFRPVLKKLLFQCSSIILCPGLQFGRYLMRGRPSWWSRSLKVFSFVIPDLCNAWKYSCKLNISLPGDKSGFSSSNCAQIVKYSQVESLIKVTLCQQEHILLAQEQNKSALFNFMLLLKIWIFNNLLACYYFDFWERKKQQVECHCALFSCVPYYLSRKRLNHRCGD